MKQFNKYELEEELKKALHNRKQDNRKYLFYEDNIAIEYDDEFNWIYADWKGYQTENSVKDGCERILLALGGIHCKKILNDNTNVVRIWTPASVWVGTNWLPRIMDAGIKHFAWVYSSSSMSRVSADESIKITSVPEMVKTFDDLESAKKWLTNR